VLVNIDQETFLNATANAAAFQSAVTASVGGLQATDVTVDSAADSSRRSLRALQSSRSPFTVQALPQVDIVYLIAFIMEERGFSSAGEAADFVLAQLQTATGNGTFDTILAQAALDLGADPALQNVTSLSVELLSLEEMLVRSPEPTVVPTEIPFATSQAAGSSGFSKLAVGAQVVIILIIIGVGAAVLYVAMSYAVNRGLVVKYTGHTTSRRGDNPDARRAVDQPNGLLFLSRHSPAYDRYM
jgi:hypothetical protein